MRIYISIPISGLQIEQQRAKAREIAKKLKELGHEPVNPFDTPPPNGNLSDKEQYNYYIGEDLKRLLTCDAIFLCEGWSESKGCRLEAQISLVYDMKQYWRFDDIQNKKTSNK